MKTSTTLAALLLAAASANATEYYCSPNGSGSQEGDSWTNAYPAKAINDVVSGIEPGDVVYLLEGTYTGTQITPVAGITVIGGFPSTATGTDLSGYNPWKYKTIFDAQGKNGGEALVKVSGDKENPYGVLTTLKGITITNCVGLETTTYCGTAFNCTHAYVLLEDMTFDNNTSWCGGVVVPAAGSRFHAKHCVWTNNTNINNTTTKNNCFQSIINARGEDGAVTNVVLEGCSMYNNGMQDETIRTSTAQYGGLMSSIDGYANFAMVNCFVDGMGKGIYQNGGMIRTGNKATLHFFAFNTCYNFKNSHATEVKGNIISFNGLTPFYMQGNVLVTDAAATANDDKINNAIFVQGWNNVSMAGIISGGDNTITGTQFNTYSNEANACTFREQQSSDNFLAPKQSEVFGSNKATLKDGRYYIQPVAAYGNVDLATALENYNSYEMPDVFKWANIDLSVDMFGNKRAATTYRGAYDPNATATSGVADLVAPAGKVTITPVGGAKYAVAGAEGNAYVYDMAGRAVVRQYVNANTNLDMSNLAAGVYVVRVANTAVKVAVK
jgi:hypothetical protein